MLIHLRNLMVSIVIGGAFAIFFVSLFFVAPSISGVMGTAPVIAITFILLTIRNNSRNLKRK
jgi:uncharacterized membrane protein